MSAPLHQQQPTTRFSDRAADYVRFRPTYPPEAIDAILDGLSGTGFQPVIRAADIGAGTGISARLLAERGLHVYAIEPNEAMREAASTQGGGLSSPRPSSAQGGGLSSPRPLAPESTPSRLASRLPIPPGAISWLAGAAESTGLPDASVDLVLCAQSYHWFDTGPACREFARILKPGGRLALMWNDGDETDPVARGYYDLVRAASAGVGPTSHQTVARDPKLAPPFDPARMRRLRFRNEQRLDADGLIGRAMSASYVPKTGEKAERLIVGLRDLHACHAGADGCVALIYEVYLYLCGLAPH